MPDNKSDDCQSCDMCKHEYEAKHVPTPGEEWAGLQRWFNNKCVVREHCLRVKCSDCRHLIAAVYDIGDSNGYARGIRDERGYAAQLESQNPKPEPAMTAEEWWCERHMAYCNSGSVDSAIRDFIKLNKGRIIT